MCIFLAISWVIKIATRITSFGQELHWMAPELCIHTGPGRTAEERELRARLGSGKSRLEALPVARGWAYYLPANVLPINWLAANHVLAFSWLWLLRRKSGQVKSGSSLQERLLALIKAQRKHKRRNPFRKRAWQWKHKALADLFISQNTQLANYRKYF